MSNEIQDNYTPGGALDHYAKDEAGNTWYPSGQVFEAWATSGRDATDYAVAMVGDAGGNFVGDFDTNTPAGHYYITTKIRLAASAADGDVTKGSGEIWWDGSAEQTQTEYELDAYAPNTVVPDVAGTAATLHGITDGLINTVDTVVDAIKVITDELDTAIEDSDTSGLYRFTEDALSEASGGGATVNWTIQVTIS